MVLLGRPGRSVLPGRVSSLPRVPLVDARGREVGVQVEDEEVVETKTDVESRLDHPVGRPTRLPRRLVVGPQTLGRRRSLGVLRRDVPGNGGETRTETVRPLVDRVRFREVVVYLGQTPDHETPIR